jgi:periplasmic protein TonB
MNCTNQIAKYGNVDDLLFRGKNKAYGAYALRQEYDQRLQRSLFFFILFTAFLSASIVTYDFIQNKYKPIVDHIDVIPSDKEIILTPYNPEILKPKPIEVQTQTVASVAPEIVAEEKKKIEIETVKAILDPNAQVSTVTGKGTAIDPPITLNPITGVPSGNTQAVSDDPLNYAEVMPEYPGGEEAMVRFLQARVHFPEELAAEGILTGKCILQFVVNEDGSISNITTVKKDHLQFSRAVVDVVRTMPRWSPGLQNGHKVKVYFQLPFTFETEEP